MAAKSIRPTKPRLKKQKRRPWYMFVVYFLVYSLLLTAGVAFYIWKVNPEIIKFEWNSEESKLDGIKEFNILLAGQDAGFGGNRTDTIMVGHVSLKDKYANFISIPRDTRVRIPGHGIDKINAAYAYGGTDLLLKTVEGFLGADIDFYVVFRLDAAIKLIDAMGGVNIDVEKNLYYRDRAQNLYINLKKGRQHLDGEKAVQYARFRHDQMGDIGRIERQQKLLNALARKATSYEIIKHLPKIVFELVRQKHIDTNLTFKDAIILTRAYDDQIASSVQTFLLPGEPRDIDSISYIVPDMEEVPYMVGGILRGGFHPRNKLVNIIVKNGCGSPMLAKKYKKRLEYYGFEVIKTENAMDFDYDKTVVIVRKKTPFANAIAKLLMAEKETDLKPDSMANLEVILGKDKL